MVGAGSTGPIFGPHLWGRVQPCCLLCAADCPFATLCRHGNLTEQLASVRSNLGTTAGQSGKYGDACVSPLVLSHPWCCPRPTRFAALGVLRHFEKSRAHVSFSISMQPLDHPCLHSNSLSRHTLCASPSLHPCSVPLGGLQGSSANHGEVPWLGHVGGAAVLLAGLSHMATRGTCGAGCSVCLSIYLSICLFVYLSVYLSVCLSIY